MSREAETRGHVTGAAGRLREARSGAITEADGLTLFAEDQTDIVGRYRTPRGHVTGIADRSTLNYCALVTEARA
ncbi:MAG TPA: hypothetical protein VMW70_09135 [Burkholderiales bacterium]|nr:hypothetical protein [Burkholderiales bacterium]